MICHHCQSSLSLFSNFSFLNQVTSDCRPWHIGGQLGVCISCGMVQKPVTDEYLREIDEIYSQYDIYSQSGGIEQSIFEQEGASVSRSQKIVKWLATNQLLPQNGKLLDVGCGNGAFLRAFGQYFGEWEMAGLELDMKHKDLIEAIPRVTSLYTGSIDNVHDTFDIIVLIHALEHIPHPVEYLKSLRKYLKPDGLLFIEVPDLENSPFDILIADHITHFVSKVLHKVVQNASFETLVIKSDFVPKELSLLARNSQIQEVTKSNLFEGSGANGKELAESYINWLSRMLEKANSITGKIGIFGSSISATWLAASLGDKVSFFVDEDKDRIGRLHMGKTIYSSLEIPQGFPVFVPLRADIAKSIEERLAGLAEFVIPLS